MKALELMVLRSGSERWGPVRTNAAISVARRLDASKPKGKPCGQGYIAANLTCHQQGAPLTPATLKATPSGGTAAGGGWKKRAAVAAGITAAGLAVGLPAASYFTSGTPAGRRRSARAEGWIRTGSRSLMAVSATTPAAAPFAGPVAMGLAAGAEGVAAGRSARRVTESWRSAPSWAREAGRLGAGKAAASSDRWAYIGAMREAWARGERTPSAAETRRREALIEREQRRAEQLARQAATRMRAARRAARISRTGAAFRSTPTPLEAALRRGLANPSPGLTGVAERGAASLTAGMLRQLQSSGGGLNRRRVRFYGANTSRRRDAAGKPCGASHPSSRIEKQAVDYLFLIRR